MLRKITLPLVAGSFILVGMFGASDAAIDAHTVAITPTMVPSPSMTATATVTPMPAETATPAPQQEPSPLDDPNLPVKPHLNPTMTP